MIKKVWWKLRHYHLLLGIPGVATFLCAKLTGKKPLFKKHLAGIRHPIYVRVCTTDPTVLRQVFWERQYDQSLPLAPKVIVDAGANIGLSAVFFANKYPDCKIIAIEPEENNFQVLKMNVAPYPQIEPVQAALWNEDGQISLFDPGLGNHGFQVGRSNGKDHGCSNSVPAVSVGSLLKRPGFAPIDLLKIDIEGAEKEVFENSAAWIGQVNGIMAELHDRIKPGCTEAFLKATKEFPARSTLGETCVCLRK